MLPSVHQNWNQKRWIVLLVTFALLVAACVPITPTGAPDSAGGNVDMGEQVRQILAQELQIDLDQIETISVEEVEWPDSCLGVQTPDTMCAQVITPGYRVVLAVDGQQFEYHTNLDGSEIQLATAPEATEDSVTESAGGDVDMGEQVRQILAQELQIDLDQIETISVEEVEWPDSCLGVHTPDTMCAQVITPGYRVVLAVDGQQFEYHTNLDGSSIQLATAPEATEDSVTESAGGDVDIDEQVRQILAQELQIDLDQIETVSVEEVEWRDACLGVQTPDTMCAQVITPGYRVVLAVDGQQFEYHTNLDGSSIQLATAPEASSEQSDVSGEVAFSWHREGGIAGFCDDLTVYVTGEFVTTNCKVQPAQTTEGQLTTEELTQLSTWLGEYASFEHEQDDGAVADSMAVNMIFSGTGSTEADEAARRAILLFASQLVGRANR